jgi:chromosome segregation ATPase
MKQENQNTEAGQIDGRLKFEELRQRLEELKREKAKIDQCLERKAEKVRQLEEQVRVKREELAATKAKEDRLRAEVEKKQLEVLLKIKTLKNL